MRLFVDKLTNIDFSYLCPNRGLVGETWWVNVALDGDLDHQGMVCDFGLVKKQIRQWMEDHIDHCLLVPNLHPQIQSQINDSITHIQLWRLENLALEIKSPKQAITLVPVEDINIESVAHWCETQLKLLFGPNIQKLSLTLSCEPISTPYYHYSHGLKKHLGQCQRIAHGHRSKLLIWRNHILCESTMAYWAQLWRDIYLGSREDCIREDAEWFEFNYQAQQGEFYLRIPKVNCYLLDSDTTVEKIAAHLADQVQHQFPKDHIRVQAFEGIGKGAIVELQP